MVPLSLFATARRHWAWLCGAIERHCQFSRESRLHQAKKNEGGKVDVHRCAFVTAVGNIGQLSQIQPEGSLVNVGVTRQSPAILL